MKQNSELTVRIRKEAENPENCLWFSNLTIHLLNVSTEKARRTRREDPELASSRRGRGRDAPEQ